MDFPFRIPAKRSSVTSTLEVTHPEIEAAEQPVATWRRYSDELILGFLTLVTLGCWWLIYRHYGLFANRDNTHFAFEKIPGYFHSTTMRRTAGVFLLLGLNYFITYWLIRTTPVITLVTKIVIAFSLLGPIIFNVLIYPVGALDVFDYMIELKLKYHYDQNPYITTFARFTGDSFALPAFQTNVHLFYGPVWLLLSWVPSVVTGWGSWFNLLISLKVFNAILLLITAVIAAQFYDDTRRRWLVGFLVLGNPLLLFEGIANAHNDVMMTTFMVGALLALKRKSPAAGPLLVLATLVKFFPLALAPLFAVRVFADRWGWRKALLTVVLSVATAAVVILPFWHGGDMVDGLREGIEQSQEMDHVSLLSLAIQRKQVEIASHYFYPSYWLQLASSDVVPKTTINHLRIQFAAVFSVFALIIALSTLKKRSVEIAAIETLLLFLILQTNFYPWYLIPVLAVIALRLERISLIYLFVASALGLFYYPMYVYAHFDTHWERLHIHYFLSIFLTIPAIVALTSRPVLRIGQYLVGRWRSRQPSRGASTISSPQSS